VWLFVVVVFDLLDRSVSSTLRLVDEGLSSAGNTVTFTQLHRDLLGAVLRKSLLFQVNSVFELLELVFHPLQFGGFHVKVELFDIRLASINHWQVVEVIGSQ